MKIYKIIIIAVLMLFSTFIFSSTCSAAPELLPQKGATPLQRVNFFKNITGKLHKHLAGSISISLDPVRWEKSEKLIAEAEKLLTENEYVKAENKYSEAGHILLAIEKEHPYKILKNGDIQLGEIVLNKKSKQISFPVKLKRSVNMPIEVLLCKPDSERSYETLLTSEIRPLHLQTMLYMAGYLNGSRIEDDKENPQGARLSISIKYTPEGQRNAVIKRIEEFLYSEKTGLMWKQKYWVFVGSDIDKGKLLADLTGESILTWCIQSSILQPSDTGVASGKVHLVSKNIDNIPENSKVILMLEPER